jgi:hypothetical protein
MISKDEARKIVINQLEFIQSNNLDLKDDELIIIDEATIEKEFGWVFFYQSKRFLETDIFSYQLSGNAPYIVNRFDGSFQITGTGNEIEYYIKEYERNLKQ